MKRRILSVLLTLAVILTFVTPFVAFAEESSTTFNGSAVPFGHWAQAGFGAWTEEDGILKPTEITEYSMLRLEYRLGQYYTIDMDVMQKDTTSGWQTIQLGFDVNAGENFTQSGLVLDLHNAGVARVITYADRDKTDGSFGSYNNPYGGNGAYVGTTDWFHVRINRAGSNYTVSVNDTTLTFTTEAFNSGYLVIGSVGNREVNYKNVAVTTYAAPETGSNTFNGETIPFDHWAQAGYGAWTEEDGVLKPTEITEYSLLRLEYNLGKNYTVDMDVKQADTTSGWQTIQIGFDVNAGENFTQSGLVLDMHNAGVARVITYANRDKTDGTPGSYNNPYGGNGAYTGTTDWFHVQISRSGSSYTVKVGSTTLNFSTDAYDGGYLVLGSVGNREVNYKNVKITTGASPETSSTTLNGKTVPFSDWTKAGYGAWAEEDGVLKPAELTEYSLLRLEHALGQTYTIDMDVKQADTTSGWQTIQIGFDVNAGENFTQSGLVLDLHNAGVARVITYADRDKTDGTPGSYSNPYGGNGAYTGTTDWFHITITRADTSYTVTANGTTLSFETDAFNGGYLVLGSVGNREVDYKNIQITTGATPETGSNTLNGETIPFSGWAQAGFGAWTEEDGVLKPAEMNDFSLLRLESDLGDTYTIDMDVKQTDTTAGWQTIQIGFDVNAGENFTQSGLVLDLHNAGVARVITYADKDKTDGSVGSYNNPYDSGAYTGTTDWFHITITRADSNYIVKVKDTTLSFTTDAFNGGYLVLGSVGSREVNYKNICITTGAVPETGVNTFNGTEIPFGHWAQAGTGAWTDEDGVLKPAEITDYSMLRLEYPLGTYYTIDMDVRQTDTTAGWQTIQLGFDVNEGENFTQSGLVLDMHNAGIARVITYADKDKTDGTVGSYAYPYDSGAYTGTTDWFHVQINRSGSKYTLKVNGTAMTFTTDAFSSGYLVLGSVGNREVDYKNIQIKTSGSAQTGDNFFNGDPIPFSDWQNAAFGTWTEENGIIAPIDDTIDFAILRFNRNLGKTYTIEFDVKQENNYSGWNSIQFGFEVNAGENFTQSGLMMDMHNLGFSRVINFLVRDGGGVLGSYDNPYGGTNGFSGSTDWIHVKLVRYNDIFRITFNDGRERTISFKTDEFNGGHFCLGSTGYRKISYKSINIKTEAEPLPDPAVDLEGSATTFNGTKVAFSNWHNAAFGNWVEENGVIAPETDTIDFAILRFNQDLGKTYTVEFDVKQDNNYSGWNSIQFGFEVNAGENFTQSGLLMDMHNLGFSRVINFLVRDAGGGTLGSYDNPYGGTGGFSGSTDWIHVKLVRYNDIFRITFNDGRERTISFKTDEFNGGHFCLGATGFRMISYKNIDIKTEAEPLPDPEVDLEGSATTFNGTKVAFSSWQNAAFGSWVEENGVIFPETTGYDFEVLRFNQDLGSSYTVDFDVRQENSYSGWNTIQFGFEVNAGENFTQSGLVMDMHNLGFGRVIYFPVRDSGLMATGSYDNPYGGVTRFSGTTGWIHVKLARSGDTFKLTYNDGVQKKIIFTTNQFNGGYLCLGSDGFRKISYKNIVIDTISTPDVSGVTDGETNDLAPDRAIFKETEGGVNTFNGEVIPYSDWSNAGFSPWVEMNGIMTPTRLTDFGLWRYDRDLGDTYTIDLDVKQADVSSGWNTIQLGFDVNAGHNFTQSGLTLDLHNAGLARVIDFLKRDSNAEVGSYSRPFGGSVDYSATTEWIHIKIIRMKSYYTIMINDGTLKTIRFETEDYNGGHLILGAVGNRDIIYKNITILDHIVALPPDDPTYPENIGTVAYTFNGNKFGEWVPTDESVWKIDGTSMLQTSESGEQTIYLDREELRNFKLTLNYDVLSEGDGRFGISFRKKTGGASYQGLGYSLLFNMSDGENSMTLADYSTSGAAALDGFPHTFESGGSVKLTASGNEFCVWLDEEPIITLTNNAYAFGTIALFTENCSVEFSDVKITSDELLSDDAWDIIDAFHDGVELTDEHLTAYNALDDFQKALFPNDVKRALEQPVVPDTEPDDEEPSTENAIPVWAWALAGAALLGAGGAAAAVAAKKRKKRQK